MRTAPRRRLRLAVAWPGAKRFGENLSPWWTYLWHGFLVTVRLAIGLDRLGWPSPSSSRHCLFRFHYHVLKRSALSGNIGEQ